MESYYKVAKGTIQGCVDPCTVTSREDSSGRCRPQLGKEFAAINISSKTETHSGALLGCKEKQNRSTEMYE